MRRHDTKHRSDESPYISSLFSSTEPQQHLRDLGQKAYHSVEAGDDGERASNAHFSDVMRRDHQFFCLTPTEAKFDLCRRTREMRLIWWRDRARHSGENKKIERKTCSASSDELKKKSFALLPFNMILWLLSEALLSLYYFFLLFIFK